VASLLGVALTMDDSGRRRGERHIKGGRRRTRNIFYMACLGAATQHNPVLKAFLRPPGCQGKEKRCAGRLHAQTDQHSQLTHDIPMAVPTVWARSIMMVRMLISLRMQATSATFFSFPLATRRFR